jgi:ribosomal protein S18 acetylase RimI-like enzyme
MSDAAVEIRPARPADAQPIGAVFDAAVLAGWTFYDNIADLVPMFPPEHWDRTVAETRAPDSLVVATVDDRVVGYAATHGEPGELYLLFVHPDAAGQGIGRRLLEHEEQALRQAGKREVFLWTHEANDRAQRLYRAAGYSPDGETRADQLQGLPEIRMTKQL